MGIQAAPEVKFALIHEATMRDNNLLKISTMCEIAGVSRSGYYRWCDGEDARKAREDSDRRDFDLILEAYQYRGYAKGARGIHMRLLHKPRIIMNVKKIRRLMRKYGLKCPIRKANPYRRMAKALATNTVAENVVNRDFRRGVRKVLLTDITYLFFGKGENEQRIANIVSLPKETAQLSHFFGDREGHLTDTPSNRKILTDLANDATKFVGTDKYGNSWNAEITNEGAQNWVRYRDGTINEGGRNKVARNWNNETGYNNNPIKRRKKK